MKKNLTIVFVALILVIFVSVYKFDTSNPPNTPKDTHERREITLKGASFDALVSDTDALRERGLSGFSGLKDGEAMLFVFQKPDIYGFWMKDMLFPIDIIWLDENFEIVHMEKNISPDTYPKSFYPTKPAQYVLELVAGTIEKLRL